MAFWEWFYALDVLKWCIVSNFLDTEYCPKKEVEIGVSMNGWLIEEWWHGKCSRRRNQTSYIIPVHLTIASPSPHYQRGPWMRGWLKEIKDWAKFQG
ncbi:predicted protein [Sclerotinia sclerotiorum 1980 UF-70]|uniref:Uncharacterized protein n=1 Tax=Sclerotinia sclerotiorum (strain ATCC 18683 / 1980 / Ss-1) TaxID=665079 RepID=A7F017_SCLS1|nr:predicted protein [Sclerotinia sclerotiorum 1980 UF-70]EDN95059.1 predicted protein [Sclerotinia sclerotiorum 1980 UF-70]